MLSYDPDRRSLAIALSGLAGFIDAVGFLSANGYFISFMSGNSTRLGVALSEGSSAALVPALLIAGFVCGVTLGALVALRARGRRKPVILGTIAVLLMIAAAARELGHETVMLAALVFAMGATNNTFQRGGGVAVGLTYMTGALVRLGQGLALWFTGRTEPGWIQWGMLWAGLLTGAVLGACFQSRLPLGCLWIAAVWASTMALVAVRLPVES